MTSHLRLRRLLCNPPLPCLGCEDSFDGEGAGIYLCQGESVGLSSVLLFAVFLIPILSAIPLTIFALLVEKQRILVNFFV